MVEAFPADPADPDSLVCARIAQWLTLVPGAGGQEHAVLSDGYNRIRLDVVGGRMTGVAAVRLRFHVEGLASAGKRLLPIQRLISLHQHGRFGAGLFPRERRMRRWLAQLRTHDALAARASQREIAIVLFGAARVRHEWDGHSDSLRSQVRRLIADARNMAMGHYRRLMVGHEVPGGRGQNGSQDA